MVPNNKQESKGTIPFPPSESGRDGDTVKEPEVHIAQSLTTRDQGAANTYAAPSSSTGGPTARNATEIMSGSVNADDESPGKGADGAGGVASMPDMPETATVVPIQLTRYIDQVPQQVSLYESMKAGMRAVFGRETVQQTIEGILGRPRQLAPITWTQDQPRGQEIFQLKLPQVLWDESSTIRDKLNNFTYMKATVNLRIAMNAMQFHQGRLLLSFDPLRAWRGARSRQTLQYQTGLRHVQIDPTKHQEGVLSVDLSAPLTHWDLQLGHYDMGVMFLSVLSPLRSAVSSQSVSITPTLYLTNVELGMPTVGEVWQAQFNDVANNISNAAYDLGDFASRVNQTGEDETGLRPASGALHDLSQFASHAGAAAGEYVPPLKMISKTASWILSFASRAVRWLGFNKPTSYRGATPVFDVTSYPLHLMDGGSQAIKLAGAQDQSFPIISDIFGTEIDECDIKYITSKLNYVYSFEYSENDAGQSLLSRIPVHPGLCRVRVTNDRFAYDTTQLAYVSSFFRRWTGSIKLRLSCVSTTFHAGRLLVAYLPASNSDLAEHPSFSNAWSVVWDISESNELEFEVPWICNLPSKHVFLDNEESDVMLQAQPGDGGGPLDGEEYNQLFATYANGMIAVSSEGPLIRAESAAANVEIQVFIAAGRDFELFHPEGGNYEPVFLSNAPYRSPAIDTGVPSAAQAVAAEPERAEAQSLNPFYKGTSATPASMLDQYMRTPAVPFFDAPAKPAVLAAGLVAGEKWANLRQLTKRMGPILSVEVPNGSHLLVDPSAFSSTPQGTFDADNTRPTYLDLVAALYAGFRGCVRYHVSDISGNSEALMASRIPQTTIGRSPMTEQVRSLPGRYLRSGAPVLTITGNTRGVEIDVPLNSIYPWHVIRANENGLPAADTNTIYTDQDLLVLWGDDTSLLQVQKGAGDDADFGILVGAPRVIKRNYTLSWTNPQDTKTIHR